MLDISFLKTNIFSIRNVDAKKVLDSLEEDDRMGDDNNNNDNNSRKRKCLDDFTPQERMVRRKLKNRVAAQNARDRKKLRMDQLETIVTRLEKENKDLKRSNEELRVNMNKLMVQNEEIRTQFGLNNFPEVKDIKPQLDENNEIITTPTVFDHDHIIKSKPEGPVEHASLNVSLPQKFQALLVSLITIWLTNPRMANYLTSLSKTKQEKVLKVMLQKKLLLKQKQRSAKTHRSIQLLLQMNLSPIFQTCLKKTHANYLNSAKISNSWWGNQTIL